MFKFDFKNLLDGLSEAVIIVNPSSDIIYCNKKAETLTKKQAKIMIGASVNLLLPEIGLDLDDVFKSGSAKYQQKRKIKNKSLLCTYIPLFKGKSAAGAACILYEQAETELLFEKISLLEKLNQEADDILESFYDGIGIIDGDGTLLRVNTSYERITGLSRKDNNVGRNVRELEVEGSVSKAVALMVLKQKKPVTIVQRIKTGKEVLITGSPVLDDRGRVYRVVCNIRDINELNILKELNVQDGKNREALELQELRAKQLWHDKLIYKSKLMKQICELTLKVAKVDSNVLITGESGVGKEIIAKMVHKCSPRALKPFLQINCGAIPETLLESELFGYEGGAFTGAKTRGKMGYFELSNGGTLLLDEIGELPFNLQVKLLRAIQEREIFRIGGATPYKFDVRIIAATNKNLEVMVQENLFRADLFYRLNVVPIVIPPLRNRADDIIPLAVHFLEKFNSKYKANKRFEPEVLLAFENHPWPGNIRELENLIERLVVINDDEIITVSHLPFQNHRPRSDSGLNIEVFSPVPLRMASEILEEKLIKTALQLFGSTRKAAKILGVSHPTVIRKAQKYKL